MTTLSTRIPENLEEEFEEFREEEKLDKSVALRKLMSEGLEEWKKERALKLLREGKTTLSRAAEIADMNIWDFAELVKKEKVTWVKDERVKEDIRVA